MNSGPRTRIRFLPQALALMVLCPTLIASASDVATPQASLTSNVGSAILVPKADAPQPYGTTSATVHAVPAWAVQAIDGTVISQSGYARFSPTGQEMEAPLFLPAGAVVSSIELQGCDSNAGGDVVFIAAFINSSGIPTPISGLGSTGATPGCGFFPLAMTPHTIDNANNTYIIAVRTSTAASTNFTSIRAYYNLQVSPAPGAATFSDVPLSDGAFQFIEAFVAAGITVGCDAGPPARYCPDDTVTRRQMAVFFAKALGLHFAP